MSNQAADAFRTLHKAVLSDEDREEDAHLARVAELWKARSSELTAALFEVGPVAIRTSALSKTRSYFEIVSPPGMKGLKISSKAKVSPGAEELVFRGHVAARKFGRFIEVDNWNGFVSDSGTALNDFVK